MKATFNYTEEEIKEAILEYHSRKITFSTRNYKIKVELPGTVHMEDNPKPQKKPLVDPKKYPRVAKVLGWAGK